MIKRVEVDKNRIECSVYGGTQDGPEITKTMKLKHFTYVDELVGEGPLISLRNSQWSIKKSHHSIK